MPQMSSTMWILILLMTLFFYLLILSMLFFMIFSNLMIKLDLSKNKWIWKWY
uniref:ATP synthase F0 subunit 8 n=1 Tax=Acropyga goeldii TaxID=602207 RepID=A0A6G5NIB8_9HYME|nr:ATP synthase F0 subunit 8 [Acropyga goeldii]QBG38582.1 ATP synthase F0 subunit 8 [Acropyga goeldii]